MSSQILGRRSTDDVVAAVSLAATILLAALYFLEPLSGLLDLVPRNFNEGWNAYWSETAVAGRALYPNLASTISNNYPPAGFFIVGAAGLLTGNYLLAGRVIALLSMGMVALNGAYWLRMNGVSTRHAAVVSAGFLACIYGYSYQYVGANDPQWLAHALVTGGLVVLWKNPESRVRLIAAIALVMLGGWVKHLLLPLPLAITAWLAWRARGSLWIWISVGITLLIAGLAIAIGSYGHDFIDSVFAAPRIVHLRRAISPTFKAALWLSPLLALVPVSLRRASGSPGAELIGLYLGFSLVVAVAASAGDGVSENAFFDLGIAAMLASGLALRDLDAPAAPPVRRTIRQSTLGTSVIAVLLIIQGAWTLPRAVHRISRLQSRVDATRADVAFLKLNVGPEVACEYLALCYWADKPFTLDFFNFGQKLRAGTVAPSECARLFNGINVKAVQVYDWPYGREGMLPWTVCASPLARNYRVVRSSVNGYFLVSRVPSQYDRPMPRD